MIWAIYVSDKPHSRVNFPIGMSNGIWGVHDSKKKSIENVQAGDLVAFVYSISWIKAEGKAPAGYSRVAEEKVDLFRGTVKKIVFGRVTRSYYDSHTTVWNDDTYPHRFEFKIEQQLNNIPFGTEFYNNDFVNSVRRSACNQGSIQPCAAIKSLREVSNQTYYSFNNTSSPQTVMEGRPIYRLHKRSERNPKIIKDKKSQVLNAKGKLECEVCEFNFGQEYGEFGDGYIECHHINPIGMREKSEKTSLDDLALLCANCHRMIHAWPQWLSIEDLKNIYERQRAKNN